MKFSLQTADVFTVVFFGGREATTRNTSAVRRLDEIILSLITTLEKHFLELGPIQVDCYFGLPPVGGGVKRRMTFQTSQRMSHVNCEQQAYHDSRAYTEETSA